MGRSPLALFSPGRNYSRLARVATLEDGLEGRLFSLQCFESSLRI